MVPAMDELQKYIEQAHDSLMALRDMALSYPPLHEPLDKMEDALNYLVEEAVS